MPLQMEWGWIWGGVSPPQPTRGFAVRSGNVFWRTMKAIERSFFPYYADMTIL